MDISQLPQLKRPGNVVDHVVGDGDDKPPDPPPSLASLLSLSSSDRPRSDEGGGGGGGGGDWTEEADSSCELELYSPSS